MQKPTCRFRAKARASSYDTAVTKQLLATCGAFVATSLTAWVYGSELLYVVARPITRSWFASPCVTLSMFDEPSYFEAGVHLALTAGALAALPLIAAQLAQRSGRAWAARRGFLPLSYLAEALAALVAHFLNAKLLLGTISRTGWCGNGWTFAVESFIDQLVTRTCWSALGSAVALQLILTTRWLTRSASH